MSIRLSVIISASLFIIACGGGKERRSEPFDIVEIAPVASQYTRQQVIDAARAKYLMYAQSHGPADGYPISDKDNTQQWSQLSLRWSSGFFPGILWQLGYQQEDPELLEQARRWTLPLSSTADWQVHDVGFLIDNTFGKGARILDDPSFDTTRKLASDTLLGRFNQTVGATRSWNDDSDFLVIIDNMMNLALLFDAARTFNDDRFYTAALTHMQTTAREFVRSDGSSYHVVHFSENNGGVKLKRTAQGLDDESTWARGQAWGIYGFALAYKETGQEIALESAINMANFYLNNLPEDNIPFWDFDVDDTQAPKDTSAAAIAATGLWLLGAQLPGQDGDTYRNASINLINAMLNDEYINVDLNKGALLKHATGNKPGEFEVDVSLIYADYYLIEALLLQQEIIDWPL